MNPNQRRRIFNIINSGVESGLNLRQIVSTGMLSEDEARWYRQYMTPDAIDSLRCMNATLNAMLIEGRIEDIDYNKLFEGFDESVPWSGEGF